MTIFDEYDRMRLAMEAATGCPLETERLTRSDSQFWMRAIISYYLYMRGWRDQQIAEAVGRDRSTIWYGRQRVQQALALPKVYWDVMREIRLFASKYSEMYGTEI